MFGSEYRPEEFSNKVKLADGNYQAKIVNAEGIETPSGIKYIKVTLEVNGNPDAYPNVFTVFDCPTESRGNIPLEELKSNWRKRATAMFDSFGITRGDFNFCNWVNKTGTITVQQQKKTEYSEVVPYKKTPKERNAPVESLASAFGGEVVSNTASNFDAIPF